MDKERKRESKNNDQVKIQVMGERDREIME